MRLYRKSAPFRVLCYAVNGLGLGHLTRLVSICRELRRLAWLLDLPIEIAFLTTSEGDSLAALHDFPAFKLPSRTVANAANFETGRYRKLAKQWIWNAVGMFAPDMLVVDTFPAGVFEELMDVLDFGQKNVFIYRAVRPAQARNPVFQGALRGYDLILKPGEAGETGNESPVPPEIAHRVEPVGTILIRSREEMLARDVARETLGLPIDAPCVYASVGGGGDREAEAQYEKLVAVAKLLPHIRFVFGAGALYLGREWYIPNVTWTRRPLMATCLPGFDAAITAGGYNTVAELLHAGVPCVFLPQPRSHDDQGARVAQCVERGAGILPEDDTPEAIAAALTTLLKSPRREQAASAAQSLVPTNAALAAAEEMLGLVVEPSRVEDAADLRNAFVQLRLELPAGWKEREFLIAVGIQSAKDHNSERDAAEVILATHDWCAGSKERTPKEMLVELRRENSDSGLP